MPEAQILLETNHLTKEFGRGAERITAVDDLSLQLYRGECLGIVGESGCGKSTLARMAIGLERPTRGEIRFDGLRVSARLNRAERREIYRSAQMVFQDPYAAFSPRMTIGAFLCEGMVYHKVLPRAQSAAEAVRLLEMMELSPELYHRLPHELSGGQLQRVVIARAISIRPKLVVLDEATSALDVSVQQQILELLRQLKRSYDLTYLMIGHDLAVVKSLSNRIAVMLDGCAVEILPSGLLSRALHPYTRSLLRASFSVHDRKRKSIAIRDLGMDAQAHAARGCPYAANCPESGELCARQRPPLREVACGHFAACHFISES